MPWFHSALKSAFLTLLSQLRYILEKKDDIAEAVYPKNVLQKMFPFM